VCAAQHIRAIFRLAIGVLAQATSRDVVAAAPAYSTTSVPFWTRAASRRATKGEPGDYLIEKAFVDRLCDRRRRPGRRRRISKRNFPPLRRRPEIAGLATWYAKRAVLRSTVRRRSRPGARASKAGIVKSKRQARQWVTYRKRPPKKAASPVSKRSDKLYTIAGAVRSFRDLRCPRKPNPARPTNISAQVEGSGVGTGLPPTSTPANASPES
jgi:hypothetical protein